MPKATRLPGNPYPGYQEIHAEQARKFTYRGNVQDLRALGTHYLANLHLTSRYLYIHCSVRLFRCTPQC